ncbi:MAG: DUF4031 domain-containing protein [Acidimicrobiales bacterium]|nr:DUF4031 domain-containing protein [Acidimicrobiales bacterium]
MAILVDEAIWPWRGRRWAHLVSDAGYEELHAFAAVLGLRRMAFQGDHYDVPAEVRDRALDLGAEAVGGRELLGRLKAAGLRLAPGRRPGAWDEVGRWPGGDGAPVPGGLVGTAPKPLVEALAAARVDGTVVEVSAWRRGDEAALVMSAKAPIGVGTLPSGVEHRLTDGGRLLELFVDGS